MAATVVIQEMNGTAPAYTERGTGAIAARYNTRDIYDPGLNYPIPIPSAGFNYSYWKSHCLDLSGTFTKINNIKWYSAGNPDWTFGTGGEVRVGKRDSGDNGCPGGSYDQAEGTQDVTGFPIEDATNGHTYYKAQGTPTAKIGDYLSGSPLQIDTTDYTAAGKTKHCVTQVKCDTAANGASQGEQSDIVLTLQWDEI